MYLFEFNLDDTMLTDKRTNAGSPMISCIHVSKQAETRTLTNKDKDRIRETDENKFNT